MFTSWSEVSTPAELSMASVLMRPPLQRELDPAALGEAEVAALADDPAAQLGAVDADRVVGLVADVGVASRSSPSRRCRCRRSRAGRPARAGSRGSARAACSARRAVDAERARAPAARRRSTSPCAGRRRRPAEMQRRVVVGPRRARQVEQPLALGERRRRRRGRGRGRCAGGRTRRPAGCARDSSMPLPNTSPDMSPMPTTVKSSRSGCRRRARGSGACTDSHAPRAVMPIALWS